MQPLYKYTDLGRPLTIAEVDENWTRILSGIQNLENGALPIRGVALIDDATGQHLGFLDENGELLATVPFPAAVMQSGEWTSQAAYTTRSIVTHEGGTFLASVQHVAGTDFWTDFDDGKWIQLGAGGASAVIFQPGNTGMTSDTVQEAIVELHGMLSGEGMTAAEVSFDPAAAGMAATSVQTAIDELDGRLDAVENAVGGDIRAANVDIDSIVGTTATNVQGALIDAFAAIDALETGSGGGATSAAQVSFDGSALTGPIATDTDVQAAIETLANMIGSGVSAADIAITPPSGMTATNVQAAIDELKGLIGSGGGGGTDDQVAFEVGYSGGGYDTTSSATNVQDAVGMLDMAVAAIKNDLYAAYTIEDHTSLSAAMSEIFARLSALEGTA